MPERSSLNQVIQIGPETTPGTANPVTKRLQSIGIEPTISTTIDKYRSAGSKYNALTAVNKEWTTAKISGRGTFTEIVWLLSSVLTTATITSFGTITKLWTFTPSTTANDTPVTYSIEHGSGTRADSFTYGLVTELGINFNRNSIDVSGSMMGRAITDGITMSAAAGRSVVAATASNTTVTSAALFLATDVGKTISGTNIPAGAYITAFGSTSSVTISVAATATGATTVTVGAVTSIALVPILATQVSVYIDTTAAGLGGTKFTRMISANFHIGSRYAPVWVLDAANVSFVTHIETVPDATLQIVVEADAQGMALLNTMRADTTQFIRVEAVGAAASIEAGQAYTFTLDFAGQIVDTGGFQDSDGLYAIEWTFVAIHDPTWNQALQVRVRNAIAQLN